MRGQASGVMASAARALWTSALISASRTAPGRSRARFDRGSVVEEQLIQDAASGLNDPVYEREISISCQEGNWIETKVTLISVTRSAAYCCGVPPWLWSMCFVTMPVSIKCIRT